VWELVCAPRPDRVIVAGEPLELLVTVTVPVALPAAVGLKITLKVRVCVGVRVVGVPAPLRPNPAPAAEMPEITTVAFPLLVTVTDCVAEAPVLTLPKLRLLVLNESAWVDATPEPLKAMTDGLFGALLTIDTVPLAEPADAGANFTLNVVDWFGLSDRGRVSALVLYPGPVALTCEIVNTPVPLFVSWMVWELGTPTVTFPKLTLDGVAVNSA